ncbi:hypothetical protein [Mesorhizobium sp. WSM3626]|uniref:hypothetical protein n=1 Tax=Mesorhizobium sp. WSM3626 TaxID=1040987 RepID=UPI0004B71E4C|nr:hypothetical protein [Mesorhizobium sp. WSM3626]
MPFYEKWGFTADLPGLYFHEEIHSTLGIAFRPHPGRHATRVPVFYGPVKEIAVASSALSSRGTFYAPSKMVHVVSFHGEGEVVGGVAHMRMQAQSDKGPH